MLGCPCAIVTGVKRLIKSPDSWSEQVILDGYRKERKRMSNVSLRCPHRLPFHGDSHNFIGIIIHKLYEPIRDGKTYMTEQDEEGFERIIKYFSSGMCKRCAFIFAPAFAVYLDAFQRSAYFRINMGTDSHYSTVQTLSCICLSLLQYPSIAKFCSKNERILHNFFLSFMALCTFRLNLHVLLFGNQILRNAHLLKTSRHWKETELLMEYVVDESKHLEEYGVSDGTAIQHGVGILSLSFYHHKQDRIKWKRIKKQLKLSAWRKKIHKLKINAKFNGNTRYISWLFDDLLTMSSDRIYNKGQQKIKEATELVWTLKRKHTLICLC